MTRRRLSLGAALALAACSSTASDPIGAASVELSASTLTVVAGADAIERGEVDEPRGVGGAGVVGLSLIHHLTLPTTSRVYMSVVGG